MNPGPLTSAAGAANLSDEALASIRPQLVAEALAFLRVGTLSFAEWAALPTEERAAFTEAAGLVARERASVLAAEILRQQVEGAMR